LFDIHAFVETYLIPAQLALAMLGMGATLSVREFVDVFRSPRGLAVGIALQWVFVPALAFGFIEVFDLAPGWAVGLCLIAVVPGGAFSNLMTFLGRGNVPLSISVTVTTTVACVVTVPLLLRILASSYLPEGFTLPLGRIVLEIGVYLLIPLTIGMAIHRADELRSRWVSRWSIRATIVLLVLITISSLQSGRIDIGEYGLRPPVLILVFGILLAAVTPVLVRGLRFYDDDTVALTCEVAVRNMGIGLLLVRFFFPGEPAQGHVLYTCLFYAGLGGFASVPIAVSHRLGRPVALFFRPLRRSRKRALE
jgi:BASS family bile acid:Na+ symporter